MHHHSSKPLVRFISSTLLLLSGFSFGGCGDDTGDTDGKPSADAGESNSSVATTDETRSSSSEGNDGSSNTSVATEVTSAVESVDGGLDASTSTGDENTSFIDGGETSALDSGILSSDTTPSSDAASGSDASERDGAVIVDPNNLLTNASFEEGVGAWVGFGTSLADVSTTTAHTGQQSLQSTGRTQSWEGPSIDVTSLVQPGADYVVSGWVRSADVGQTFHILRKASCVGDAGAGESSESFTYFQLAETYTNETWAELVSDPFTIPDCELESFVIFFEGPSQGESFYIDDVALLLAP